MSQKIKSRPRNFFPSNKLQDAQAQEQTQHTDLSIAQNDISTIPISKDLSFNTSVNEKDISTSKIDAFDLERSYIQRYRPDSLLDETTLTKIKRYYQLRAWSLIYPFLFVLIMMFSENQINERSLIFAVVTLICMWSLAKIKCLEPKTNIILIMLISCCILLGLVDFLFQFSVIGDGGWKHRPAYIHCWGDKGPVDDQREKIKGTFCGGVGTLYFINGMIYVPYFVSFAVYLFATFKLMGLTSYEEKDEGFRFKLEDEIDEEK